MNDRKRMIARVYRKNPNLLISDSLLLPDSVIKEVMADIIEFVADLSKDLSRMGIAAEEAIKSFDWRRYYEFQ